MYFGRWSSNKGLFPALALFAELHRNHPEWRLIIAGREYDHNITELQEASVKLGIADAVTLASNPSDDEIQALLRRASYFLCLSRHEGFGIAPIEAMSAGLTPVLSNIPPFQRLIDESGLGFCFAPDTQQTDAINQLLQLHDQGEAAYQARVSAAQTFSARYAWPKVADRYLALYDQLRSAS
jgi:alpha-1,3-mannosyltransferase